MTEKYKVGDYEFDTWEEYQNGLDDLKKIDVITSEMDVADIYIALGLYERVRNKEIVFKTPVGTNFFMYLADIVVSGSKELLEERKRREQKRRNKNMRSFIYRLVGVALILVAVGFGSYIWYDSYLEDQSERALAKVSSLQNMTGNRINPEGYSEEAVADNTSTLERLRRELEESAAEKERLVSEAASSLEVLPEFADLYASNMDFVGWLYIEGTNIDYPVMQTDRENGQYYLTRSFFGDDDKNGSLFLDYRNDLILGNTNLIIYGHNMRSGAMFGNLKNFLNEDYMKAHSTVEFSTLYEHRTYEVIGAGLSEVSYDDEYTFRYYNFIDAGSVDEMDAFKANMVQLLATDRAGFDVSYGDELLTLSTCSSYTDEGRMFVLAKRV